MRRFILLLIFSCVVFFVSAQEKIYYDSIANKYPKLLIRQPSMDKTVKFDDTAFPDEVNSLNYSIFDQPFLSTYNKNLDFIKYLNPAKVINYSYSFAESSFNPVFPFGRVFNQSAYQLNDRIIMGGNSYGAQSVFDRSKINSTIQDMSIKSASMFMQYKVTDHFKVQTRISISNGRYTPWEP